MLSRSPNCSILFDCMPGDWATRQFIPILHGSRPSSKYSFAGKAATHSPWGSSKERDAQEIATRALRCCLPGFPDGTRHPSPS
jgi:hypothetical protein